MKVKYIYPKWELQVWVTDNSGSLQAMVIDNLKSPFFHPFLSKAAEACIFILSPIFLIRESSFAKKCSFYIWECLRREIQLCQTFSNRIFELFKEKCSYFVWESVKHTIQYTERCVSKIIRIASAVPYNYS